MKRSKHRLVSCIAFILLATSAYGANTGVTVKETKKDDATTTAAVDVSTTAAAAATTIAGVATTSSDAKSDPSTVITTTPIATTKPNRVQEKTALYDPTVTEGLLLPVFNKHSRKLEVTKENMRDLKAPPCTQLTLDTLRTEDKTSETLKSITITPRCVPGPNNYFTGNISNVNSTSCPSMGYCTTKLAPPGSTLICPLGEIKPLEVAANSVTIETVGPDCESGTYNDDVQRYFKWQPNIKIAINSAAKETKTMSVTKEGYYTRLPTHLDVDKNEKYGHDEFGLSNFFGQDNYASEPIAKPETVKQPYKEIVSCQHTCDYGKYIFYQLPNGVVYDVSLYVHNTCDWIQICTAPKIHGGNMTMGCSMIYSVTLALRNQFVTFGKQSGAVPMRFFGDSKQEKTRIDVQRLKEGAQTVVENAFGERTISLQSSNLENGIMFSFSHSECLVRGLGIDYGQHRGSVYLQAGEDKKRAVGEDLYSGKNDTTDELSSFNETLELNVTTEIIDEPVAQEVAPAPISASEAQAAISAAQRSEAAQRPDAAKKVDLGSVESGWSTWMIFSGFLAGSVSGSIIWGGIFYLFRRSVFASWYRGMYKRYGCDASGTTGGATGADFGNTTQGGGTGMTGGTTAGTTGGTSSMSVAESTIGGTTATETAGTTGGNTTSTMVAM